MAKIILNNEEFDFTGYNRTTYFNENTMNSTAYISGLEGDNLTARLQTLGETAISSISIVVGDKTIYNLANLNGKINSMDESYNGTDTINTNINLQFN